MMEEVDQEVTLGRRPGRVASERGCRYGSVVGLTVSAEDAGCMLFSEAANER